MTRVGIFLPTWRLISTCVMLAVWCVGMHHRHDFPSKILVPPRSSPGWAAVQQRFLRDVLPRARRGARGLHLRGGMVDAEAINATIAAVPDFGGQSGQDVGSEGRGLAEEGGLRAEAEEERGEKPKFELLKHAGGGKGDPRKLKETEEQDIALLPDVIGKRVIVLFPDGRNVGGILRSFDRSTNLLLTNCSERVFPQFAIDDSDLESWLRWPPETQEEEDELYRKAGVGNDDEIVLPMPGRIIIRGDQVAGVCKVRDNLDNPDDWLKDPFPRVYAYAIARSDRYQKTRKFTGDEKDYNVEGYCTRVKDKYRIDVMNEPMS